MRNKKTERIKQIGKTNGKRTIVEKMRGLATTVSFIIIVLFRHIIFTVTIKTSNPKLYFFLKIGHFLIFSIYFPCSVEENI